MRRQEDEDRERRQRTLHLPKSRVLRCLRGEGNLRVRQKALRVNQWNVSVTASLPSSGSFTGLVAGEGVAQHEWSSKAIEAIPTYPRNSNVSTYQEEEVYEQRDHLSIREDLDFIIAEMAEDGVVCGVSGVDEIQVAYEPFERDTAPVFVTEGTTVRADGCGCRPRGPAAGNGVSRSARRAADLRIANLAGEVTLDVVNGDRRLEALAGAVTVGQADGDPRAEGTADRRITGRCHGDLRFEAGGAPGRRAVRGSAAYRRHGGEAGHIHGDLNIEKLTGSLRISVATAMPG